MQLMNVKTTLIPFLFCATGLLAATANITIFPGTTYQTWKYWAGQPSNGVNSVARDPNFANIKAQYIDQIVNQFGINTLQINAYPGDVENTTNCCQAYQ